MPGGIFATKVTLITWSSGPGSVLAALSSVIQTLPGLCKLFTGSPQTEQRRGIEIDGASADGPEIQLGHPSPLDIAFTLRFFLHGHQFP